MEGQEDRWIRLRENFENFDQHFVENSNFSFKIFVFISSRQPRSASRQRRSRIPRSNHGSRGPSRDPSPGSANRSKLPSSMLGQTSGVAENLLARKLDGLMNDGVGGGRAESPSQWKDHKSINKCLIL